MHKNPKQKKKDKKMKKTILAALATVSCALLAQQAHAFTGSVQFGGAATASGASGAGITTITFTNPWHVLTGFNAPDGVYAGSDGTATTMMTFSFTGDGATAALTSSPVSPEWSFIFGGHTYTFDLEVLTNGHTQSGSMSFSGTGTAFIDGGQATAANWSLQGSASGGFTFRLSSATTASASTPDGGSAVALLGLAFAGIEGVRRMLQTRKA
jgi:hypothetical protein